MAATHSRDAGGVNPPGWVADRPATTLHECSHLEQAACTDNGGSVAPTVFDLTPQCVVVADPLRR